MNESKLVLTKEEIRLNISLPNMDSGVSEWHISLQPPSEKQQTPQELIGSSQIAVSEVGIRSGTTKITEWKKATTYETVEELFENFFEDAEYIYNKKAEIPNVLHQKIISFLLSIPNILDNRIYRVLIAKLDSELQAQIDCFCPPQQFVELLIPSLLRYGELDNNGIPALEVVLRTAREMVGRNRREECDKLIQETILDVNDTTAKTLLGIIQKLSDGRFIEGGRWIPLDYLDNSQRIEINKFIKELQESLKLLEETTDKPKQGKQRIYTTIRNLKYFIDHHCNSDISRIRILEIVSPKDIKKEYRVYAK